MVRGAHLRILVAAVVANLCYHGIHALENQINKLVYNNNGLGSYSFEYETSDGAYRREDGGIASSPEGEGMVVRGEYGYIDSLGRPYTVRYIADANGFQPQNDELNTRFNDRRIV